MDIQTILVSLLGSGSIAWVIVKVCIRSIAADVINEQLEALDEKYTTKEQMQIERKELLLEVERRFLEKVAFQEFTKRFDDKFDVMAKTLDKVVENQEHIKDYIIRRGDNK